MAHASTLTPAHAQASCVDDGCDGANPVSTGCATGATVERTASFSTHGGGVVELVFNLSCHAGWGFIRFNSVMSSGHTGDAQIFRLTDSASQLCSNAGGNGVVLPGQTTCHSGMLGDGSSESAIACGYFDNTQLACTSEF
ncbi:MAG TPA: DUF2690 domain-containing protein [Ktedonobacteraceae bacterium]|nr:DUF2690 domain-containing protein [Ktedonobacteraceae bacterium]